MAIELEPGRAWAGCKRPFGPHRAGTWFLPLCLSRSLTGLADGLAPKGSATRSARRDSPRVGLGSPDPRGYVAGTQREGSGRLTGLTAEYSHIANEAATCELWGFTSSSFPFGGGASCPARIPAGQPSRWRSARRT